MLIYVKNYITKYNLFKKIILITEREKTKMEDSDRDQIITDENRQGTCCYILKHKNPE